MTDDPTTRDSNAPLASGLLPRTAGTRAWPIRVNGEPLTHLVGPVRSITIDCVRNVKDPDGTRLGWLEYGAEPNTGGTASPYDTWLWLSTGGAVTLPFAVIDYQLYVGVATQRRFAERHETHNPNGMVENAPRGMHDPGVASRKEAAAGELAEEIGALEGPLVRLEGQNVNPDSAWLRYTDELEDGVSVGQGGVTFFAIAVNPEALIDGPDGDYRFRADVAASRKGGDKAYEMITGCRFIPWQMAVRLRDGFTAIATARLMAQLTRFTDADIAFYGSEIDDGRSAQVGIEAEPSI